jgi:hypothetical protein
MIRFMLVMTAFTFGLVTYVTAEAAPLVSVMATLIVVSALAVMRHPIYEGETIAITF